MANWAYKGIELDNKEANIKAVFYTAIYFQGKNLINPQTQGVYDDDDLAEIKKDGMEGKSDYNQAPDGAAIGIQTMDGDYRWFNADEARKIVEHADALVYDKQSEALKDLRGNIVAREM